MHRQVQLEVLVSINVQRGRGHSYLFSANSRAQLCVLAVDEQQVANVAQTDADEQDTEADGGQESESRRWENLQSDVPLLDKRLRIWQAADRSDSGVMTILVGINETVF